MELPAHTPRIQVSPQISHRPNGATRSAEPSNVVVLKLPASSAYLSILRTATAGLAALARFTLDEIEDLRIAVDEACAVLLASHPAAPTTRVGDLLTSDAELTCRFTLRNSDIDVDEIEVEVSLPFTHHDPDTDDTLQAAPFQHTFAWQVLSALTDDVQALTRSDELLITLTKRRAS